MKILINSRAHDPDVCIAMFYPNGKQITLWHKTATHWIDGKLSAKFNAKRFFNSYKGTITLKNEV